MKRRRDDHEDDTDPGGMPPVRIVARTPQGKVGRLTHETRETLNLRLLNNEPAKKILAWLNGLTETVQVCAEYWNAEPVSAKNLSEWKNGNSYAEWLERRTRVEEVRTLMAAANEVAAAGGRIAGGLVTYMAGDLMECFEKMRREGVDLTTILEMVEPVTRLAAKENEALKLSGQNEERKLRQARLDFDKDKFVKASIAALRKHAGGKDVAAILNSGEPEAVQDRKLEQLIFGELAASPY